MIATRAAQILASCPDIPTIPAVALDVLQLARDPEVSIKTVADTISRDVALCSRLLKVVNSPYYGLQKKVGTVNQAIVMLGLNSAKTLALGFSLVHGIKKNCYEGLDFPCFWRRSLCFAVSARAFAECVVPVLQNDAFVAGLLADVGVLALASALGRDYTPLAISDTVNHMEALKQERQFFGVDHQQMGCKMAQSWQLPELLIKSIANHHSPGGHNGSASPIDVFSRVIYVANLCAETFSGSRSQLSLDIFQRAAHENLGLEHDACQNVVENLHTDIAELDELLEIDIPEATSCAEIIHEANEELTRFSLEAQLRAQRLEQENLRAARRLQELQDDKRRLAQSADRDALTGLNNRRFFEEHLERELVRAERFDRPLSVLFIDVDYFKKINDQYGHIIGDGVLRQVAQRLQMIPREIDCLCRYGGEEFVLTLPETDLSGARIVAERMRELIAASDFQLLGSQDPLRITVSIGVATMAPRHPMDKEALVRMADQSLYAAKRQGRNRVCALVQPDHSL